MNKIEEFWYCVAPQEDLPCIKDRKLLQILVID